jgi:hypothetical protein
MNVDSKTITYDPVQFRFVLKILSAVEAAIGACLLAWAVFQFQSNGWSLQIKGMPGSDVHLVVAGMIILAAATGAGLIVAAAGLIWTKKWPFVLHAPLIAFWVYVILQVVI